MKKAILSVLLIVNMCVYSQSVYLKTGKNLTNYHYISSEGKIGNLMQPELGDAYELGYTFPFRKLSRFSLDVGLSLNEYNSVVGISNLNIKWNTAYIGILNSLSFSVIKLNYVTIDLKTGFNVVTILYGKQDVNGVIYDIRNNKDFDGAIYESLFGVQANLKTFKDCNLSIGYNFVKSIDSSNNSQNFSFNTNQIIFGVHVYILKSKKK